MIGALLLAVACESYFIDYDRHALMKIDGQGVVSELLTDEEGIGHARISPDRRTILYDERVRMIGNDFVATFVLADRQTGKRLHSFKVSNPGNAIMDFGWANDRRIWIDGHWSPRSGSYSEVEVDCGRVLLQFDSETFARSPRGTIAYTAKESEGSPHRDVSWNGQRYVCEDSTCPAAIRRE